MARVLPYPSDLAEFVDRLHGGPKLAPDTLSSHGGDDYLPSVFARSFFGSRGQSVYVARLNDCLEKADELGGLVFEYVHRASGSGSALFGFTVAKDEEDLRNRLSVYYVMTS